MAGSAAVCACGGRVAAPSRPSVALVGHANVGKSVLFQRLTGRYVVVANYPGTTVEVARGTSRFAAAETVLDTPGILTLPPRSEDERVVLRAVLGGEAHTLVHVGDAKNLRRTLLLAVQLAELGLPLVLALNMLDEARALGIGVNVGALAERLGFPVVGTVATRGEGIDELARAVASARPAGLRLAYPEAVERAVALVEPLLPEAPVSGRSLALLWLAGDEVAGEWVAERSAAADVAELELARERAAAEAAEPLAPSVQRVRAELAAELAARVGAAVPVRRRRLAEAAGRVATHGVLGWPVLAAVLYAVYLLVGVLGAGKLVGLLEGDLFGGHVNPWVTEQVERLVPVSLLSDLLVGEFGLWTMGMTYALALILPIVATFFLAFGVLEDSGYLPRLAVVSNRAFARLGLNGKAALPVVLGLGCVTMATLTTRVLETRRERTIATLLLALGIPCSAQLGVVLGMLAAVSLAATLVWGAVVAAVVVAVGALAARVLPGERPPLVVELPPLRMPRLSNVVTKTVARVEWYLREVVPLFLLGTALLFALDRTGALDAAIRAAEPLVVGWLGLPPAAATAFLVGFLRRDFGAVELFTLQGAGGLTDAQTLVAMVTVTLFIPCIASVLVLVRERGRRAALAIAATVFPLAFLVGGVLHRVLAALEWGVS